MKKEEKKYPVSEEQIRRASKNLAKYLGDLLSLNAKYFKEAEPLRNRILADVKEALKQLPERERGLILSAIAVETQKIFTASGSPKVGVSGGCVGKGGAGVTVTEGNLTVKGCVIGTLKSGPEGGGAEVTLKY